MRRPPATPCLLLLAGLLATALVDAHPAAAQRYGAVAGTPHDFRRNPRFAAGAAEAGPAPLCRGCHTDAGPAGDGGPALQTMFRGRRGGAGPGAPAEHSLSCLSCHDGIAAAEGTSRHTARGGHPVSVPYEPFGAQRLNPATTVERRGLKLFGSEAGPSVECASCHDPHDNREGDFLRVSNEGSALCLTCHDR